MNEDNCRECREAEALDRVLAAQAVLDAVVWAEMDPQRGVASAMVALRNARSLFDAAGFPAEP
jgi:hypothetical protein